MAFHEGTSLHLDHVIAVYVVILDKLLDIDQIGSSFSRNGNLSTIT